MDLLVALRLLRRACILRTRTSGSARIAWISRYGILHVSAVRGRTPELSHGPNCVVASRD